MIDAAHNTSYKHQNERRNPVISNKIPGAFKHPKAGSKKHQDKSLPPQGPHGPSRIKISAAPGLINKKSVSPIRKTSTNNTAPRKANKILVNASKLPHDFMPHIRTEAREEVMKDEFRLTKNELPPIMVVSLSLQDKKKIKNEDGNGRPFRFGPLSASSLKLEDMVSLAMIKSSDKSGPLKKMMHVPTLKIYCVKEVPISSREVR